MGNLVYTTGLSSMAGLNAYLPLLLLGLMARATSLVGLQPPFDLLTSVWAIGPLVVLLLIELVLDKVPGVASMNDAVQTVVRPLAGAVLFAAGDTTLAPVHPALPFVAGIFVAGAVHTLKINGRSKLIEAGRALPVAGLVQDMLVATGTVLAVAVPGLGSVGALVLVASYLTAANFPVLLRRVRPAGEAGRRLRGP